MNLRVRPRVKHDYEEEILKACVISVILVGIHAGQPSLYSTTYACFRENVVVAETSYQNVRICFSFWAPEKA